MKKVILLLLTVTALLALAACGEAPAAADPTPAPTPEPDARDILRTAEERMESAASLDYDVGVQIDIDVAGESVTIYTDGRYRYNNKGSENYSCYISSRVTGIGDDQLLDVYYSDGTAYESGPYGKYKAPMSADGIREYLNESSVDTKFTVDDYDVVTMEKDGEELKVAFMSTGDNIFDYLVDTLGNDSFELDKSSFEFSGVTVIGKDGAIKSEVNEFKCGGVCYGTPIEINMTLNADVTKINEPVAFTVPASDADYVEISDIHIPGLLFGAYDSIMDETGVSLHQTAERSFSVVGSTDLYSETYDLAYTYGDKLNYSLSQNNSLNGTGYDYSEYYDGSILTAFTDGERAESTDYTDDDVFSYVQEFYNEYYIYPEDIKNISMTEEDGVYRFEYDYIDTFTDWDASYYYSVLYDTEDIYTYADNATYGGNHAVVLVDAESGLLQSHEITTNVVYNIDDTVLTIDMHYLMDITDSGAGVQVVPCPVA